METNLPPLGARRMQTPEFCAVRDAALARWAKQEPRALAQLQAAIAVLRRSDREDDAKNIAYIAFTAPEPCRAVFFGALRRFSVSALPSKNGLFIASLLDKVFLPRGDAALAQDARGPYTTFFHECGHAVDFNTTRGPEHFLDITPGAAYSRRFRKNGVGLQQCIREDVAASLAATAASLLPGDAAGACLVAQSVRRGGTEAQLCRAGASPQRAAALCEARQALLEHYRAALAGPVHEAASDLFGGMTNNVVRGAGYYHNTAVAPLYFWQRWYWFLPLGVETGAQSRELFAEYFSYCMTRNAPAQQSVRQNLPRSFALLGALLEEMAALLPPGAKRLRA